MKIRLSNVMVIISLTAAVVACSGGGGSNGVSGGSSGNNSTPLSSSKAITTFSIVSPAVTGTINENVKTIALVVSCGTKVNTLVTAFATTGTSVTVNNALQTSGVTQNDFTLPVTYQVTAADGSNALYTVNITTDNTLPAPAGINITSGDGYAVIKWNAIAGVRGQSSGIAIARKSAASGYYSIAGSVPIDQTAFIDTGLTPNSSYSYKLYTYTSYDPNTISCYTAEYNIVTGSSNVTPAAPTGLTAGAVNGWSVNLSWADNSSNEDGFSIERSTNNIDFVPIKNTYINVTSYRDNSVTAAVTFYYRVKAFNAFGASSYSPAVGMTTPAITPTTLGGGIAANVTLTQANNPYLVNSNFTLAPGYTMTIEPGVQIRFAPSTTMEIRGQLTAVGTPNNPILFTAADPTNTSQTSWDGIHVANNLGGSALIQHAEISHAAAGVRVDRMGGAGPVDIYDSVFDTNSIAAAYYSGPYFNMMVYRSTFLNNWIAADSADKIIAYSKFKNNTYGLAGAAQYPPTLYGADRIKVYYSLFTGNSVALWGGNGTEVKYSVIQNNDIAVKPHFINMSLLYNTIADNAQGVIVSSYNTGSQILTATIHNNNIFGNANYDIVNTNYCYVNTPAADLDATNNWWGTTSTAAINSKHWDFFDDPTLGIVHYTPLLATPVDTIP